MSNKYKILELLKQEELTIKEIATKTKFSENEVRTYIHRLLEDSLIKEIGKKNRWCIYAAIEKKSSNLTILLKDLHSIMNKRMNFIKKPTEAEIKTIKIIEELIK